MSRPPVPRRWMGLAAALHLLIVALVPARCAAWGDRTHVLVNRLALETLRGAAAQYFRPHAEAVARMAVEPDSVMRAREGDAEKVRHYIDLDRYMPAPFTAFPRAYDEAVGRFGKRRVERNGVLPWVIVRFERQLREAIRRGDVSQAVHEAAYLGHYVADSYQPLHLTENHDGQRSGATGIHKRFEDRLVDARLESYEAAVRRRLGEARHVSGIRDAVFEAMFESYTAVAPLIAADAAARSGGRTGSAAYYDRLDDLTRSLVERQLSRAATMLGSLWQTAWEEAAGK